MAQPQFSVQPPSWLEPPPSEEGSVDPLGFLAPAENIAERILPGVTVATGRARYLSFLCWAIQETGGRPAEIDRWEVALSIGEHIRHLADGAECNYLGRLLVRREDFDDQESVPRRLHIQTARRLYSGLLRSMELVDDRDQLSDAGKRIASEIAREMPRRMPRRIAQCEAMPCLSRMRAKEQRWLREALLDTNASSRLRRSTFQTIGKCGWRTVRAGGVERVLANFLPRKYAGGSPCERSLHEAAKLELQAMPLTRLFMHLYRNQGSMTTRPARHGAFRVYRLRDEPATLLADVIAHLRKAAALGDGHWPLRPGALYQFILGWHRVRAKPESPWVDTKWNALRLGLGSQQAQRVHAYRLSAFASLLYDLEVIT